jgi:hypothetical protein
MQGSTFKPAVLAPCFRNYGGANENREALV